MLFKKIIQAIKRRFRISRKKPAKKPHRRIPKKSRKRKKKSRVTKTSRKAVKIKQKKPLALAFKKPIKPVLKEKEGKRIGEVTHFFSRIKVCVIKITSDKISIGDQLRIKGRTSSFIQKVQSLQIENSDVPSAGKGKLVGLKIAKKVRPGDQVFKI